MIGYLIDLAVVNAIPDRDVATLLTQVEVAADDATFAYPSKPIGTVYSEVEARRLSSIAAWPMIRDGAGWRRAVASPAPRRIREIDTIRLLLRAGVIVVCAGGGGVPVIVTAAGALKGVEAVIDKDMAAALLAEEIGADVLLLLTDVPAVFSRWPMRDGQPIPRATPGELRAYSFAAGSIGPKVEAACRFVERTGGRAGIGAIDQAVAILAGRAGTLVRAV